jgi:hypothetical protein
MELSRKERIVIVEAPRDVEITRAVMLRHANLSRARYATLQTRSAAQTVNFPPQTQYADRLLAYVTRKRYAVVQTPLVQRMSMLPMDKVVGMGKNAQLDNVHLETYNASNLWVRI